MDSIARNEREVYVVRVSRPDGWVEEVSMYGLTLADGLREGAALREVLSGAPTPGTPETYREVWVDVVAAGISPRECVVQLARRLGDDEAGGENGYAVVRVWSHRPTDLEAVAARVLLATAAKLRAAFGEL